MDIWLAFVSVGKTPTVSFNPPQNYDGKITRQLLGLILSTDVKNVEWFCYSIITYPTKCERVPNNKSPVMLMQKAFHHKFLALL